MAIVFDVEVRDKVATVFNRDNRDQPAGTFYTYFYEFDMNYLCVAADCICQFGWTKTGLTCIYTGELDI